MRFILLSFVAISCLAWPCQAAVPSLCKADETVVFSCSTGAHVASLCASKNISKSEGTMQYRYGKGDKLDLTYPDPAGKPADVFTSGTLMFSGGGGAYLRFDNGIYRYTVFTAIGKWAPRGGPAEVQGVAIKKDGKEFANFPCRGGVTSELGPDLFDRLGLKSGESPDDFDIPEVFFPK